MHIHDIHTVVSHEHLNIIHYFALMVTYPRYKLYIFPLKFCACMRGVSACPGTIVFGFYYRGQILIWDHIHHWAEPTLPTLQPVLIATSAWTLTTATSQWTMTLSVERTPLKAWERLQKIHSVDFYQQTTSHSKSVNVRCTLRTLLKTSHPSSSSWLCATSQRYHLIAYGNNTTFSWSMYMCVYIQ